MSPEQKHTLGQSLICLVHVNQMNPFKHFEIFPQIQNFNFFEYFMLRYLHEFNTLIIFILIWNDFSKFRRLEYSCRFLCDAFERRIRKSRQCCGTPAPLASNRNRRRRNGTAA